MNLLYYKVKLYNAEDLRYKRPSARIKWAEDYSATAVKRLPINLPFSISSTIATA